MRLVTGYNIREGSRILAERFALLDERRAEGHSLRAPLVEQVGASVAPAKPVAPSPRWPARKVAA